jgi:excisionase family DNA binding protein
MVFVRFWLVWLDGEATIRTACSTGTGVHSTKTGRGRMKERWLSVNEIAAHLGVNRDTIYKWIERKKLPAHKVGRLWKFMASEVGAWVRAGRPPDG